METESTIFDKIGGRKFILSILTMGALVTIAIMSPTSMSTELIVGLLGVIATYSGSNSFLTAAFTKLQSSKASSQISEQSVESEQVAESSTKVAETAESIYIPRSELEPVLNALNERTTYLETTLSQVVEIVKQQNLALSRLQQK